MYYVNKSHCLTLHKRYLTPLLRINRKTSKYTFYKNNVAKCSIAKGTFSRHSFFNLIDNTLTDGLLDLLTYLWPTFQQHIQSTIKQQKDLATSSLYQGKSSLAFVYILGHT